MAGLERLNDFEWQVIQATADADPVPRASLALEPESGDGEMPQPVEQSRVEVPNRTLATFGDSLAFARDHVRALAIVLIIVIVAAFMWSNRVTGQAIEVEVQPRVSESMRPESTPEPQLVQVHVIGAVRHPGVVSVPKNARVLEAVTAAGGLTENADSGDLNLAAFVVDGSQVKVGSREKPGGQVTGPVGAGGGGPPSSGQKVNLNQATVEQLDSLPGVGPVTAGAILSWRERNGPFKKIEQLQEVDGIGPKSFQQLKDHVAI